MAILLAGALMLAVATDDADVQHWATEAGVDATDLAGAVNSTGLGPHEYLVMTGEVAAPAPAEPVSGIWDRLSRCEANGNWAANTGNGYYGGLQEDMVFWRNYGGIVYAKRPDLASRSQQIAVAQRGLAAQGFGAWPVCSRRLGLR